MGKMNDASHCENQSYDTESTDCEIFTILKDVDRLPSLPMAAIEILQLTRGTEWSVDEISDAILSDPSLTARLLKVVNSPMYGVGMKVSSVNQAVALLGIRSITVMALSFSMVDMVQVSNDGDDDCFDFDEYWKHSIMTAVAARQFATASVKNLRDDAFVAGLLADLGIMAAYRVAPELYKPVIIACAEAGCNSCVDIEKEILGVTHADITAFLLGTWGLPENLCESVAFHHKDGIDDVDPSNQKLAAILQAATLITELFCGDRGVANLEMIVDKCAIMCGIASEALEEILHDLEGSVAETASLLSVSIGETTSFEEVRTEATLRIAQLSVQSETALQDSNRQAVRLQEENRKILKAASTDGLTKIANRSAFDERLSEEIDNLQTNESSIGLIILDVDHFKKFNDTYGHQAGDAVLRVIGLRLSKVTHGNSFVARYGGEEFVILMTHKSEQDLEDMAEKIRLDIESQKLRYKGEVLAITASCGGAWFDHTTLVLSAEECIESADKALYLAKSNGRNRVEMAA